MLLTQSPLFRHGLLTGSQRLSAAWHRLPVKHGGQKQAGRPGEVSKQVPPLEQAVVEHEETYWVQ